MRKGCQPGGAEDGTQGASPKVHHRDVSRRIGNGAIRKRDQQAWSGRWAVRRKPEGYQPVEAGGNGVRRKPNAGHRGRAEKVLILMRGGDWPKATPEDAVSDESWG